jgi:hypothetical protein
MLKITADTFSGRENPQWVVEGKEAQTVLKELALARGAFADAESGSQELGFRGLIVEPLSDNLAAEYGVPSSFRVAGGNFGGNTHTKDLEVAERLIKGMLKGTPVSLAAETAEPFDKELQKFLLDQLTSVSQSTLTVETGGAAVAAASGEAEEVEASDEGSAKGAKAVAAASCAIEVTTFNPGFWNLPAHIGRNNCYNYASNRRTDTFAQPGRASGQMYSALTCAQVGPAAVRDGARAHPNCAPASESPRWYMALVIAPGPGVRDYHWYRKCREGFWGHKPGGTAARNTDNSGHIITDPRTANRGPYTIFCGFYYAQRRMVVR